jgi:hypothetical protein
MFSPNIGSIKSNVAYGCPAATRSYGFVGRTEESIQPVEAASTTKHERLVDCFASLPFPRTTITKRTWLRTVLYCTDELRPLRGMVTYPHLSSVRCSQKNGGQGSCRRILAQGPGMVVEAVNSLRPAQR